MGMAVPKNSPYYKFLRNSVIKVQERGTHSLIRKRWIKDIEKCPVTPVRAINVEKIFTVFFILIGGALLALTILLAETLTMRIQQKDHLDDGNKNGTGTNLERMYQEITGAQEKVNSLEIPGQDLYPDKREALMNLETLLFVIQKLDNKLLSK